MAALHVPATIAYDAGPFAWSIALAVTVSTATLWFAGRTRTVTGRLAVAVAMGGGLTLMHAVAVHAGHFVPDALWREEFRGAQVHSLPEAWLAPWVALATAVAVGLLAAMATLDRRRETRAGRVAAGDPLTGLANGTLLRREIARAL